MTFLRKKLFWVMLFVVTLGFVLRVLFINKPDGLWNDEYVSWAIASIPIGKEFFKQMLNQCHMPFYYFYLKFFIHFFGNSDLMLRLTSVPAGVFAIISMYFVGKELKDERVGVLCASISSISSFLIYFSQEVRFYELLFLFSALLILFTIKLLKNQNKSNIFWYIIFNLLVILTHTIGFIFVILNFAVLTFLLVKDKEEYKNLLLICWGILGVIGIGLLPFAMHTINAHPLSQCWGGFTVAKLAFLFTDYFSPVLTNIVSSPDNFFYNFSLTFIFFEVIPTVIAITGIVKAVMSKDKRLNGLLVVAFAYLFVMLVLAISGKLMFVTKYSIEIYPILILAMGYGFSEFKKGWHFVLVFSYVFLTMFYLTTSEIAAFRIRRSEGHKIVADLLKNSNLEKGDFILLNYYPKSRFEKYFDFSKYNVISINKGNFYEYLGNYGVKDLLKNGKEHYQSTFKNPNSAYFDAKFKENILNKVPSHKKLVVVILKDVSMYSPMQLIATAQDEKEYRKAPFLFLSFSYIKNSLLKDGLSTMQIMRLEQKGSWAIIEFQKK